MGENGHHALEHVGRQPVIVDDAADGFPEVDEPPGLADADIGLGHLKRIADFVELIDIGDPVGIALCSWKIENRPFHQRKV